MSSGSDLRFRGSGFPAFRFPWPTRTDIRTAVAIAPGMRVGKYEVKRLLGQGGFGMVFVVRDLRLDRDCALKFLLPEHTARPEILQRFLKEARSAAKIDHGGIVTVFECGVVEGAGPDVDGTAYIAMELLRGESLSDRLQRGPLLIEHAIEIARQVASALAAAHAVGIVHRDLKPDNIFLVPDAATALGERVKVLDFGIAKLADDSGGSAHKTSTHMIFGTPRYMSPEQCKSTAKVDERSDIYALGCMLFEMVCGRPPFEGDSGELIAMHQLMPAPTASSSRADLPASLDAAITAMLAKQPADRPSKMNDVLALLGARVSAITPVPSKPVEVAPTIAPDATMDAPAATAASTPPTPAAMSPITKPPSVPVAVAPTPIAPIAAGNSESAPPVGPVATVAPAKRNLWPFAVLGGVVLVGGVVAIVAMGGKPTTHTASDAVVAIDDARVPGERTGSELLERYAEYWRRAKPLIADRKCTELERLVGEARAVSPLIARELGALGCEYASAQRGQPDPAKIYAMPATGAITLGPANAKVTLVESGDYACPWCFKVQAALGELRKKYGADLRIVSRPYVVHRFALAGSLAACAAAKQGDQSYERFDALLWARTFPPGAGLKPDKAQQAFDPAPSCWETTTGCPLLMKYAQEAGLDLVKFKRDLTTCVEEIEAAERDWKMFGLSGVPSFFINGHFAGSARSVEEFSYLIDKELAKANERIAQGTLPERYYQEWVIERGLKQLEDQPPPISLDSPDPLESQDILARPAEAGPVSVRHILIGWNGSSRDPRAVHRPKADADVLAGALVDRLRSGGDLARLMEDFSEDPGSRGNATPLEVSADSSFVPPFKQLALRLRVGEVGLVRSLFGWHVIKRLAPPPLDPLESRDILARAPRTQKAQVKHILLGWTEANTGSNTPGATRDRLALEVLVGTTLAKLAKGVTIEQLMKEVSEDPGSSSGKAYEVTPTAGLVEPFLRLSLRLDVNEVGVVRTQFGIHIIKRVE